MTRGAVASIAAAALWLAGCGPLGPGYMAQAVEGQFWLLRSRRPLDEVVADEKAPERARKMLGEVPRIKQFGEQHGLKATRNYETYVDVGGPAVTWVVSACDPLAFRPVVWSFPVIGAITYVGWFERSEAVAHGERLRGAGLDVDVRGAGAYSTLGWLRDPVLSSMLHEGDGALGGLVDIVLHESVHATYYVNGQSYLNESLASFVAEELTRGYLRQTRGPESTELRAYERDERSAEERREGLHRVYLELERLYASPLPPSEKLAKKAALLADARRAFRISRPLNNAVLIQYKTYGTGRGEFRGLLEACGGSWPRFWASLRAMPEGSLGRPQQEDIAPALRGLIARGCAPL